VALDLDAILDTLGTARKFADPLAPKASRLMAASGALPLPPAQIATVLLALSLDEEQDIRERAERSLRELPDRVVDGVLTGAPHPGVLAVMAERFRDDAARLQQIALNAATTDETFCLLASLPHPGIVDICSRNQTRLLRCPALVDTLAENPVTGQATIDRVLEFLGINVAEAAADAARDEGLRPPEPIPGTASGEAAPFDPNDTSGLPEELLKDSPEGEEIGEPEEDDEHHRSLLVLVGSMNVMQKVKLARFGNGEARNILVRDRNRVVSSAAISSPKIKESEVLAFAKSRNIAEEILRVISNNREWTRSRAVKMALVMNPKTPLNSSIKFVNHLTDQDLRSLMRSKDVPGQVSLHARRILTKKGKL